MSKDKIIPIRFKKKDYDYLRKKAKEYKKLNHPDSSKEHISTYCRKVLTGRIDREGRISGDRKEIYELWNQVRKVGNNINQIARVANETGQIDKKELDKEREKIGEVIYKILEVL